MEGASATQMSAELEAVAARVARLFPARREFRANSNANSRSAAADWPHTGSNSAATQPSGSQVGAPLASQEWVREATRTQKLYSKRAVKEVLSRELLSLL